MFNNGHTVPQWSVVLCQKVALRLQGFTGKRWRGWEEWKIPPPQTIAIFSLVYEPCTHLWPPFTNIRWKRQMLKIPTSSGNMIRYGHLSHFNQWIYSIIGSTHVERTIKSHRWTVKSCGLKYWHAVPPAKVRKRMTMTFLQHTCCSRSHSHVL